MKNPVPTFTSAPGRLAQWLFGLVGRRSAGPTAVRFDPLLFLRELASMLRSGLPLHQALGFTADGFGSRARRHIDVVRERVEAGEPLSQALGALPARWAPEALRATVAAGERAGSLPDLLEDLAVDFELLAHLDRRLRSTFVYPIAVLTFAAFVFQIVMAKVLPTLIYVYGPFGSPPMLTVMVSKTWKVVGPVAIIALPIFLLYLLLTLHRPLRFSSSTALGRLFWWRLPVVRGLRKALIEVRFARTLRLLLDSGVPLPESLDLCEKVVSDDLAGTALVASARRIRDGEKPSVVLRGLSFLSPAFLWFIADSERRGDFLEVTRAMSDVAEERFATRMEVVEGLLEPVSTLVLGVIVGVAVIALYQSMFSLIPLVGNS